MRGAVDRQDSNGSGDITCCCRFPSCLECRDLLSRQPLHNHEEQRHPHKRPNGAAACAPVTSLSRSVLLFAGFGVAFLIASYAMFAFRPVDYIITTKVTFSEGSLLYDLWTKPPVNVYVKVFVFNITNPSEFLTGKAKMKLVEIGPYVYKEVLENTNVTFNPNNSVTYVPKRRVSFVPSMSVRNPHTDMIFTPNVALLGMASMLHNSSSFLNIGLATLARALDSQPLINISVHEMLWGYDEPLVRLASKFLPNWISFTRLGLMDRMFDEGLNTVTMTLDKNNSIPTDEYGRRRKIYTFDNFNGLSTLKDWSGGHCNSLSGVSEGILYPRKMPLNESYVVYRKAFCRLLPMQFNESGVTNDGFPAYFFRFPDNIFDSPDKNPENSCYCRPQINPCLLSGLADITPCYYSIPLALSLPHFLRGDPRLFDKMEGLSPNNSKHGSLLAVQPDLGLPLMVQTRMQLNLHVHNTKLNPRTMLFNNVTLPIFWIDWYFDLPDVMYRLFYLILFVAPVLQTTLTVVFALLGAILLGLAACSCNRKNTAVATKILSKSQHLLEKNTGEQSLLGRAQYKAQIVSRRSRNLSPVTR